MNIDFVLWDHDGVLVDSEPWFFEATRRTLFELDIEVMRERWLDVQARGLGLGHVSEAIARAGLDMAEIRRVRDDLYERLLRENPVLIDGALDVLGQVGQHRRMGLVTTSLRRFVDQLHGESTLLEHFDCVITAEDCDRHKPHPQPYLRAMSMLGASPTRTVAVEDSPRGLASAVAAGLRCFVVRNGFMDGCAFEGAHAIIDDIRELPSCLRQSTR